MQAVLGNGNFGCRCWMWWSNYSSSISSRRGPYSRTYAICQSPPPDSRRIASGDTTLTLSSSNLNHSSNRRQRTEGETSRPRPSHRIRTSCRAQRRPTFFPLDPAHVVTRWAGAALVCEHRLQVIVAAVVWAKVCGTDRQSVKSQTSDSGGGKLFLMLLVFWLCMVR